MEQKGKLKRVAFFVGSMAKGGTERVVLNFADYLYKQGCEICIITGWTNNNEYVVPEYIERIDVSLSKEEWTNNKIYNVFLRARKRKKILQRFQPDVILSFIRDNNYKAILIGRSLKIPVIVAARSTPEEEYSRFGDKLILSILFSYASGIVIQTEKAKEFYPKHLKRKLKVLPNPIGLQFIKERFEGVRNKEIVTVGRLDKNKNQILLLQAFEELKDTFPDWKCILYGDGTERRNLEKWIQQHKLNESVRMEGNRNNIEQLIYKSSIFVLTSDYEGMPNALIEAMVLGLPVISTDCRGNGPREIIRNGENGILIANHNKDELVEALRELMGDGDMQNKLGRNAALLKEKVKPEVVNKEWMEYIINSISKKGDY